MWLTDPRVMLLSAGVAVVASEQVRKVVGRGFGYVAAGTMKVGGPVAHAAEEMYDEARHVTEHDGAGKRKTAGKSKTTD